MLDSELYLLLYPISPFVINLSNVVFGGFGCCSFRLEKGEIVSGFRKHEFEMVEVMGVLVGGLYFGSETSSACYFVVSDIFISQHEIICESGSLDIIMRLLLIIWA